MNPNAPEVGAPESRFARTLGRMQLLGLVHVFIALNLIPVVGIGALYYAFFPPAILLLIWACVDGAPMLSLLALGPCLVLAPTLLGPLRARIVPWARWQRALLWAGLAIWLPIASAETVRAGLIHGQLAAGSPRCQRTEALLVEQRARFDFDHDGIGVPGTWMVRGDELLLWNNRTLRFEPAGDMERRPELPPECRDVDGPE